MANQVQTVQTWHARLEVLDNAVGRDRLRQLALFDLSASYTFPWGRSIVSARESGFRKNHDDRVEVRIGRKTRIDWRTNNRSEFSCLSVLLNATVAKPEIRLLQLDKSSAQRYNTPEELMFAALLTAKAHDLK